MSASIVERRSFDFADFELRSGRQGSLPTIRGYAAVFDRPADIGDFREVVLPGAFANSLKRGDDVLAKVNHEGRYLLGRVSSGTLTLSEDGRGLLFSVRPPDTSYARNLVASMKRGDIKGASFSFVIEQPKGQRWTSTKDSDVRLRQLVSVRLLDVAVVATPAYADASASIRAYHRTRLADAEAALIRKHYGPLPALPPSAASNKKASSP